MADTEQKRYHIIAAAVVFAVLTWLSITMRDEYIVVKQIPVIVENMKEGRALKYPLPKYVNVRFKGNGWQLAGLYLSPDVKYYIDVSSLGPEEFTVTGRDLLEHIKLPVELQPVDVKPETLYLAMDEYREKTVPIGSRVLYEFRDGYGQVGPVQFSPDSVRIGGSRTLLENITGWPTAYRKFDDLRAPLDVEIPLEEPVTYSIRIFTQSTRMHLNVQPFAEKTLSGVPLICFDVPPSREVIFIPPKVDLIVRGGIDQIARLGIDSYQATVSYDELMREGVTTVVPHLNDIEGVQVVSKKPDRFRFIIRRKL